MYWPLSCLICVNLVLLLFILIFLNNIIFIGKLFFLKFDVSYTGEQCGQWASLWFFFFFLEIHIICIYVITISFLSYNSQSPNRTSITLQQPNGTVLWNANFSFSSEHPEQMPFNAYSPEASVKVNPVCDFFVVDSVRYI